MGNRKTKFPQVLTNNNSRFIIKTIKQKNKRTKTIEQKRRIKLW